MKVKEFKKLNQMNIKMLFLVFALLTNCATAQNEKSENAEKELKNLINQLIQIQYVTHDFSRLEEIFSPDFREVMATGTVNLREQTINSQKIESGRVRENLKTQAEFEDFDMRLYNDFAVVIAKVDITFTVAGETPRTGNFRISAFCHKENKIWKITSTQLTRIMSKEELMGIPAPPPPARKN